MHSRRWKLFFACSLFAVSAFSQQFSTFLIRVYTVAEPSRNAIVDSFFTAANSFPFIDNETTAVFLYRGAVSGVTVPGDANGWSPTAYTMSLIAGTDCWYTIRYFASDARLDYKFVLNSSTWILDPRNPHQVSGGFGPNSELRMPAYPDQPELVPRSGALGGALHDTLVTIGTLGNSRTVKIYTPPGFGASSDSVGLILVHDGLEYVSLALMPTVLDNLINDGLIPPVVVVFVPPINRNPEYAGADLSTFGAFLANDLVPKIVAGYRVSSDPARRVVMGASNGGNISLYMALAFPNVFGRVAAFSPNIISSISNGFQVQPKLPLKLYLDIGTYDIASLIPLVQNFLPVLSSKGYPYFSQTLHEGHSWGNWRAHVDDALIYLLATNTTGVHATDENSDRLIVGQPFPQPTNPGATLRVKLPTAGKLNIALFDILGRSVRMMLDDLFPSGEHNIYLDAKGLSSGTYVLRIEASGVIAVRKLVILR